MPRGLLLLLGLSVSIVRADSPPPVVWHIAPSGNDAGEGTVAAPLATLEEARDRIRHWRASGKPAPGGFRVVLEDGVYARTNAFRLTTADSGTKETPVVYCAAHPAKAILSGGVRVPYRKVSADDPVVRRIPSASLGKVFRLTLPEPCPPFAGGRLRPRAAAFPHAIFEAGRRLASAGWPEDELSARLGECPFRSAWTNDAACWFWVAPNYLWDDRCVCATNRETLARLTPLARYRVINSPEELDRPGEWAVGPDGRTAYVRPYAEMAQTVVASAENLLDVREARQIAFEGLVFECVRGTAVTIAKSEDVAVRGCIVRRTMGNGIEVTGGVRCRVESCDLHDLGLGGVRLAGGDRDTLTPAEHAVRNCHISDYGRFVWNYRPGVHLSGVGNRCEHNLIHDARHQGIAFVGNDHLIRFNVVHDVCRGNEDSGAIYAYTDYDWSCGRGTRIEYNLVHAVGTQPHGSNAYGIYIDGYVSGVKVRHNLVSQAEYGVFQSGGQANVFEQNLVLSSRVPLSRRNYGLMGGTKPYHHVAAGRDCNLYRNLLRDRAVFERPVWKRHSPELLRILDFPDPIWAQNALFTVITNNVCAQSGASEFIDLEFMRGYYTITNNVTVAEDPGLTDWKGFDWTFRSGALAQRRLGCSRFDEMGLVADGFRPTPPVRFGAGCTRPLAHKVRPPAHARIDIVFSGTYSPEDPCAESPWMCSVPAWDAARRYVVSDFGDVPADGRWREHAFSFVPRHDDSVTLDLVGGFGEKTYFDDVRVEGASLLNGDFEGIGSWMTADRPAAMWPAHRLESTDLSAPRGLVRAQAGVWPAGGAGMAAATEIFRVRQRIRVLSGRCVTVRFKVCGEIGRAMTE